MARQVKRPDFYVLRSPCCGKALWKASHAPDEPDRCCLCEQVVTDPIRVKVKG
jgi:hypothetical protein